MARGMYSHENVSCSAIKLTFSRTSFLCHCAKCSLDGMLIPSRPRRSSVDHSSSTCSEGVENLSIFFPGRTLSSAFNDQHALLFGLSVTYDPYDPGHPWPGNRELLDLVDANVELFYNCGADVFYAGTYKVLPVRETEVVDDLAGLIGAESVRHSSVIAVGVIPMSTANAVAGANGEFNYLRPT